MSELFFYHVLEHLLIQAQISHKFFEKIVFFFQLLHLFELCNTQTCILFFQLKKVACEIPILRQISSTLTPDSDCLIAKMICDSVNFDVFIVPIYMYVTTLQLLKTLLLTASLFWWEVTHNMQS